MNDHYITSLCQTMRSLLNSIERYPGLPMDVSEFASSAVHKLGLLEAQLAKMKDQVELSRRRGDRGYMGPNTLPYGQTINLPKDENKGR